jgi:hypothetical protein
MLPMLLTINRCLQSYHSLLHSSESLLNFSNLLMITVLSIDWVLALRGVRIRVRRVLPSLFLAPPTTKRKQHSNQPKPITHPIQSHPSTQREERKETPKPREEAFICMFCGRASHLDEFCFWRKRIEGRRVEYARDSYRDEFFDVPPQSYSCIPPHSYSRASSRPFSRALPRTSSSVLSQFAHGPNHRSYGFGPRENRFEPICFGYGPRPHRGDRFPRRPSFPAGGSFTHFELRHLDGPCFPHHGSRPTQPCGEVQRTVKTSSGRMVKCWIHMIYLTNPSTEPSTFSCPV